MIKNKFLHFDPLKLNFNENFAFKNKNLNMINFYFDHIEYKKIE
jgi:hypothetical protein